MSLIIRFFQKTSSPIWWIISQRNPEDAIRRLNGEFALFFVELRTETIWVFTSESGNAALFYNKSKEGIQISNSLIEIAGNLVDNKQIFFQRIYDILAGNSWDLITLVTQP